MSFNIKLWGALAIKHSLLLKISFIILFSFSNLTIVSIAGAVVIAFPFSFTKLMLSFIVSSFINGLTHHELKQYRF